MSVIVMILMSLITAPGYNPAGFLNGIFVGGNHAAVPTRKVARGK